MTNAIDTKRFEYSAEKRNEIRAELGLEGKFVIGNVARLSYQKNHEFLIEVFAEIRKVRDDAFLMLVGRGELEEEIRNQVACSGLSDSVLFMGARDDVPDLLNAMDVFVLPSSFEGLPVALVETQSNGLPTYASDSITKEIAISDCISYLPLEKKCWANAILKMKLQPARRREEYSKVVLDAGYDINREASKLEGYYNELYELWNRKK